jgi:hypothetical protein
MGSAQVMRNAVLAKGKCPPLAKTVNHKGWAVEAPGHALVLNSSSLHLHQDDAAVAAPLKKLSRSALIWSALVVGMPCGKPL